MVDTKKILFASYGDLSLTPPSTNLVNYLASIGQSITILSYHTDLKSLSSAVEVRNLSPTNNRDSVYSKLKGRILAHIALYDFLRKRAKELDFIFVANWTYKFLDTVARFYGFQGKIVYQFHELEFSEFRHLRRADRVIIPEANRLWITYFRANLSEMPFLLPNIPSLDPGIIKSGDFTRLKAIRDSGKKILLYQGYVDNKKRCLEELVEGLSLGPEIFDLVIMPSQNSSKSELDKVVAASVKFGVEDRLHIVPSHPSPYHLNAITYADVGIGLYRPISLNQVYAAPNRLYEFARFNVPCILPNFPHFVQLAKEYKFGINVVDPEQSTDIAKILHQLNLDGNFSEGRTNASKFWEKNGEYSKFASIVWQNLND